MLRHHDAKQTHDASVAVVCAAFALELLQGGTIFGWNALSLLLRDEDVYRDRCDSDEHGECNARDLGLQTLWTAGIFSLNFGAAVTGPLMDRYGPLCTALLGSLLHLLAVTALLVSLTYGVDLYLVATVAFGLGGMSYHSSCFHMANMFPRRRGFMSAMFVGFFTLSGIVFLALRTLYVAFGGTSNVFHKLLVGHLGLLGCGALAIVWIWPRRIFKPGERYSFRRSTFQFYPVAPIVGTAPAESRSIELYAASTEVSPSLSMCRGTPPPDKLHPIVHAGLIIQDSSISTLVDDPISVVLSLISVPDENPGPSHVAPIHESCVVAAEAVTICQANKDGAPFRYAASDNSLPAATLEPSSSTLRKPEVAPAVAPPGKTATARGPADGAASPRFSALQRMTAQSQMMTMEYISFIAFFVINVLSLQFYLGTAALQLERKGDHDRKYTDLANVFSSVGIVVAPLAGYLIDSHGFGVTMLFVNVGGITCALLQAVPLLEVQLLTLTVWTVTRFVLYSGFFTMLGALFGYSNFGTLTGIASAVNGFVGLLQYPLTDLALTTLEGDFTWINISQAVVLLPFLYSSWCMRQWERHDAQPPSWWNIHRKEDMC